MGISALSLLDKTSSYVSLVPGMLVVGLGAGLFYSSVTTAAVTALGAARASLAGGIVYMCQIGGGAIGLGLNTAIVTSGSFVPGIQTAFRVDAALAAACFLVVVAFVEGTVHPVPRATLRWHHRAHV